MIDSILGPLWSALWWPVRTLVAAARWLFWGGDESGEALVEACEV